MTKVVVMPLTEEQISKLPFPDTARKIGGLLVIEPDSLVHHLNLEAFRKQWNDQIKNSSEPFRTPIMAQPDPYDPFTCDHQWFHYQGDDFESCSKCGACGGPAAKDGL